MEGLFEALVTPIFKATPLLDCNKLPLTTIIVEEYLYNPRPSVVWKESAGLAEVPSMARWDLIKAHPCPSNFVRGTLNALGKLFIGRGCGIREKAL